MKNTNEGNKLIAEFMGYTHETEIVVCNYGMDFHYSYDKETVYSNMEPKLKRLETQYDGDHEQFFDSFDQEDEFKYKSYLSYHKSWDELMPVVEKIEEEYEVSILGDECEISTMGYRVSRIVLVQDSNKLNGVYKAVVEFIQWYNRNEK
jgi:hypothetical protein